MSTQRSKRRALGNSIRKKNSGFKLLKFDGSFYCNPITTESDYFTFYNEINKLKQLALEQNIVVIKVKGLITLDCLLKSYKPDYIQSDVIASATKSIKLKEQRIENGGDIKVKDQFRYFILLSMDWADTNVFPIASRYQSLDGLFEHYDRSHVMEFGHRNLLRECNTSLSSSNLTDENIKEMNAICENEISSKDALDILKQIEKKYPTSTANSEEFLELKQRLENSDASERFSISKLLTKDGVDCLLNRGLHNFTIVIGESDIVINELKNINNKFNEWQNINFEFADLINKLSLTEYIKTHLMDSEWDSILESKLGKLIGKAEEYRILPILALSMFNKSDFTKANSRENFESLCLLMEGKDKSKKTGNFGISAISETIDSKSKLEKNIIRHLYSAEVFGELTKLQNRLKKLAKYVDKNQYDVSKIEELAHQYFGINLYPLYAAILVNDNKMFNKKDDELCTLNAKRLIQTFINVFFGNDIFTIDEKNKKATIFPNGEFADMVALKNDTTSSNSDSKSSKSHLGRAHHFTDINLIEKLIQKFNEITGNQGSNIKATKKEIQLFQSFGISKIQWFELDSSGEAQIVGWDDNGDPLPGTSLEHLENTNHHHLVLRYLGNNVKDGATDKQIVKVSEWYDWIATTQEKYKNKYPTEFIYKQTVESLKYIAEQKQKENN
jgi:hypothetical protein